MNLIYGRMVKYGLNGNLKMKSCFKALKITIKSIDNLFRKYYPMLCAYAKRFVSIADAEEIVQDTMLWIYEHRMKTLFILH